MQIGFVLAKCLVYEERWKDASEVLDIIRREIATFPGSEIEIRIAVENLRLWIGANQRPQDVRIDEVNAVRSQLAMNFPVGDPKICRGLDLTEAVLQLNIGDVERARILTEKVRSFDEMPGKEKKCAAGLQRLKVEAEIAKAKKLEADYEKCLKEMAEIEEARVARRRLLAKELDRSSAIR